MGKNKGFMKEASISELQQEGILEVQGLKKYFPLKNTGFRKNSTKKIKAVDGVSFSLKRGETLGLVGESGSGKSTIARSLVQLYKPDAGKILYQNVNLNALSQKKLRPWRRKIQMIFQDPYSSLDPRMTIEKIISEAMIYHGILLKKNRRTRVQEFLHLVGLPPDFIHRFPHQLSGGQRQRIGIARALALEPEFLICDNIVSTLDISIQAQVMAILEDLQNKLGLSYLLIVQDLSLLQDFADRIAVLYLGKIVELSSHNNLYQKPLHPFTEVLLKALDFPPTRSEESPKILPQQGASMPSPAASQGCRFAARCPYVMDVCRHKEPPLQEIKPAQWVACYRYKN